MVKTLIKKNAFILLIFFLILFYQTTSESLHQVRLMYGNGLSKDIWSKFQNRFHIPQIIEFFGATEGNVLLINTENKVGAVGRISPFLVRLSLSLGLKTIL